MSNQITDGDKVKVYRVGQSEPLYLDPKEVIFTDRTRIESNCKWKRYVEYEYNGMGVIPTYRNDHLALGAAVHEGNDLLLQGGTIEKAFAVAQEEYINFSPWPSNMPEEKIDAQINDGVHLIWAFIYAFDKLYLPIIREEYEVLEVEEETNWLLGTTEDGRSVVVMSRLDGVLRRKSSGRIWHVSHKTHGRKFDGEQLDKLKIDIQRFSEGYAIWAKYGEAPEGTLYNYFLKGERKLDEDLDLERYTSGLIRPYINRLSETGGDITPEMISFQYEWNELDQESMQIKKRRLGKGWEKVDIYKEMDYVQYLDWLSEGLVLRPGRNYLSESVSGLVPVEWNIDHAARWARGTLLQEEGWGIGVDFVETHGEEQEIFPLNSSECFNKYGKKCSLFKSCWGDVPLDNLIAEGHLTSRTPNHLVELMKINKEK